MYYPSIFHPIAEVRRWPLLHPQYTPSQLAIATNSCCLHGHHAHTHAPSTPSMGPIGSSSIDSGLMVDTSAQLPMLHPHPHHQQQYHIHHLPSPSMSSSPVDHGV
jgi:hypothetical protein